MDAPLLEIRGLSKSFPGVRALSDVRLEVRAGEVHALMGENGAGKSTLARIIAGLERPDAGAIRFRGQAVRLRRPHDALRLGISMIHQELLNVPEMTVAENIFLGREPARGWGLLVDRAAMNRQAGELLGRLGSDILPTQVLGSLSVAGMQTVEIARALACGSSLIIMDEPTSALSAHEADALLRLIGQLAGHGVAVLYVSHKLEEVFRVAGRATVLRDGRHVASEPVAGLSQERLISLMVGRELEAAVPAPVAAGKGEVVLGVRGLGRRGRFAGVSFDVRAGEVLGIAGLMGAGRTDVLHAIFGLAPADQGQVLLRGRAVRVGNPRQAMKLGIGLVSEDRKRLGLVLTMSLRHNLTLADLGRFCRGPVVVPGAERAAVRREVGRFGVRASGLNQNVRTLSGGNQQKVVIAKALLGGPEVVLLDEPTRGIDVGAKAEVYSIIRELARQGKAIVLVSSELPEVLGLSDRLLVMRQGRVTAELDARRTTAEEVMRHAVLEQGVSAGGLAGTG